MNQELYFWATHAGAEIDLYWHSRGTSWGVEFKYTDAPKITRSMKIVCEDLELEHLWVVYPGDKEYKLAENITAFPLENLPADWNYKS